MNSSSQSENEPRATIKARGMNALTAQEFNALASVGGIRGLIEAVAPGLAYLVLFVITRELSVALVGSLSVAAVLVVLRLIQRTPVTMAFSGVVGVGIGLFVAWKSGDAQDFYVWGLLVNAAYMIVMLVTVLVRWPGVGVLVEMLKSGLGSAPSKDESAVARDHVDRDPAKPDANNADSDGVGEPLEVPEQGPKSELAGLFPTAWRKDPQQLHAYSVVTWLWVAMFGARLVVQLPLYFMGEPAFAALGAARLIMGVPLFALVLWLSWRIIRQSAPVAGPQA